MIKNSFAPISAHQQCLTIQTQTLCFHFQVASCKQTEVLLLFMHMEKKPDITGQLSVLATANVFKNEQKKKKNKKSLDRICLALPS